MAVILRLSRSCAAATPQPGENNIENSSSQGEGHEASCSSWSGSSAGVLGGNNLHQANYGEPVVESSPAEHRRKRTSQTDARSGWRTRNQPACKPYSASVSACRSSRQRHPETTSCPGGLTISHSDLTSHP